MNKPNHDYLMKVKNDSDGWALIKQMRQQAKACGSKYKLVLRGSKPKTPWGWRVSIPLDDAQEIRIYIRKKDVEKERKEKMAEYISIAKYHKRTAYRQALEHLNKLVENEIWKEHYRKQLIES